LQTYGADALIDRLKDQNLEHQHRIKGRPPAFRSIKPLQRLIEQRPEPLDINHRRHGLQRIAQIANPLQPLNNVKKIRAVSSRNGITNRQKIREVL
jgi:hypothetical protein